MAVELSIVIPVFKKAKYLPETLDSVLKSSFQNFEIIVVNDGSPDDTDQITECYLKKDVRIKYLKQENSGVCIARNNGVKMAKADFVICLDADDLIGKHYLKKAFNFFKLYPETSVVYPKAVKFTDQSKVYKLWYLGNYNFSSFLGMCVIPPCGMFKKKDFEKIKGFDPKMKYGIEDWEFWINLLKHTNGNAVQIDYLGYKHRANAENSRHAAFNSNSENMMATTSYIYEKHKDLYQKYFGNTTFEIVSKISYNSYRIDRLQYFLGFLHPKNLLNLVRDYFLVYR